MSLFDAIKSALGIGERTGAAPSEREPSERAAGSGPGAEASSPGPPASGGEPAVEPDAASERAVKTDAEPAAEQESAAAEPETTPSDAADAGTSAADSGDPGGASATGGPGDSTVRDEGSAADASRTDTTEITGIGSAYADRLADAGVETVAQLAAADAETLAAETDLGAGRIEGWIEQAQARTA